MADAEELIVEFVRGVSEDDARAISKRAGASVRRRMRTDHQDLVMLLLKIDAQRFADARAQLDRDQSVARTEPNPKSFSAL
ncbi:MAG: hypothetical protein IT384_01325 [Deltaproteobacteria bacterium]|nr:hypothetical protein [Deltaproteobacteria bacterium]